MCIACELGLIGLLRIFLNGTPRGLGRGGRHGWLKHAVKVGVEACKQRT
jgi:hypothetical protein